MQTAIFDMDGTPIDNERASKASWRRTARIFRIEAPSASRTHSRDIASRTRAFSCRDRAVEVKGRKADAMTYARGVRHR